MIPSVLNLFKIKKNFIASLLIASMSTLDPFTSKRNEMVQHDIQARGVCDVHVLESMNSVPRHLFVPNDLVYRAYDDSPLPIGEGQTISQPYIVALMAEAAKIKKDDKVLEVGTGCGYAAAVYSKLATKVYTTEIIKPLGEIAKINLRKAEFNNVEVIVGDGSIGLIEQSPFDAIIVAAAAPNLPKSLVQQLAVNGRLVIPVRFSDGERLLRITLLENGELKEEFLEHVRFVPLRGAEGFN
jgi:protein-L-isoaspartate(D-aspartate) O-methyltransferase